MHTRPCRVSRLSSSTSSPFSTGTGAARVTMMDAKNAKMNKARRVMLVRWSWGGIFFDKTTGVVRGEGELWKKNPGRFYRCRDTPDRAHRARRVV